MCKSKIHRATVIEANLFYTGSVTIDKELMALSDIYPFERVQIANLNNGERLETYVMEGEPGSGKIALNGAAARLAEVGDKILIISYCILQDEEARIFKPKIIHVDGENRAIGSRAIVSND
jgi:aspartate 1-decarboxylase